MSSSPTDIKEYRKLISFLGRQRYNPVRYRLGGTDSNNVSTLTPWVARAIAETAGWPSEIVIVTTQQAWDFRPDGETEPNGVRLTEDLAAAGLPFPTPRIIQEEDQWGQFLVLKDLMRMPATEVFLDISYGFRSLPFFAAAVTAFVRAVDDKTSNIRVFYGAYEARDEAKKIAPLWELTEFVALLDWAQALRMFLRTGRAEEVENVLTSNAQLSSSLIELRDRLSEFSLDLQTLRTGRLLLELGGRPSSAASLLEAADRARNEARKDVPALADVLDHVIDLVRPLAGQRSDLSGSCGHAAVSALADLYCRLGRYLEAMLTMREGYVNQYAKAEALCPGSQSFRHNQRKKAEERAASKKGAGADTNEIRAVRNDLSHAQYVKDPKPAGDIIRIVESTVERFKTTTPGEK